MLDTLVYLRHETDVWVEITTLLIPGLNDSDTEIAAECAWIREHLGGDVPLHFTAFHPDYKMLDRPPTPPATLTRARRIAIDEGLQFVYTGNVHDADGGTTSCPGCGAAVIVRDWYCDAPLRAVRHRLLPRLWHPTAGRLRRAGRDLGRPTAAGAYRLNSCS